MPEQRKYMALKGRIRELGTNYQEVADEMGIKISTLSNKLNGHFPFRIDEVEKLAEILNIKEDDIVRYFFPDMFRNAI